MYLLSACLAAVAPAGCAGLQGAAAVLKVPPDDRMHFCQGAYMYLYSPEGVIIADSTALIHPDTRVVFLPRPPVASESQDGGKDLCLEIGMPLCIA